MSKAIRGVYKNGVIELLEEAEIAEGTEATITFTQIMPKRMPNGLVNDDRLRRNGRRLPGALMVDSGLGETYLISILKALLFMLTLPATTYCLLIVFQ